MEVTEKQRRHLRRTHLKANSTPSRSTLIHDRTSSNGVNLGRQTKPQKPNYKRLSCGPIRGGHMAEPLVARQVVLGPRQPRFLSPKQLYWYKKTPIHWYFSSTITGISWSTPKTSNSCILEQSGIIFSLFFIYLLVFIIWTRVRVITIT